MSINQYFSSDIPQSVWWSQHHQQQQNQEPTMEPNPNSSSSIPHSPPIPHPNSLYPHLHHHHQSWLNFPTQNRTRNFNLNEEDDDDKDQTQRQQEAQEIQHYHEKEPMFEKPLTPSDVGKLNRLVIPKQHAEKYFPFGGGDSGERGLLLSFEDEAGKCWRFRYSYWNSSQSYVLTKGWSRYVKEKQLDAGDVVFFERDCRDGERLFIGWRRRGVDHHNSSRGGVMVQGSSGGAWSRGLHSSSSSSSGHQPYPSTTSCVPYQPDCLHAGSIGVQNQAMPIGNSKRLRLFGVNLECQQEELEPSTPDGSSLSSLQGPTGMLYSQSSYSSSSNSHNQMEFTLSGDVKQMRNRAG